MQNLDIWVAWLRPRIADRNERGFTAVEWLIVALGVIAIAGIAVAAVQAYVTSQTNKLGSP
jgi:Tfp pilus assembly protein PilE